MNFLLDEHGQDLTEYTLLLLFVVLAIMGIANGFGTSVATVANITNSNLAAGITSAS
ncbi:MAG: Flp family type IVb pilin [Acidobacteriia bacterium]|nr:Flp family type IVb pilin [Terriglobia bacterium]